MQQINIKRASTYFLNYNAQTGLVCVNVVSYHLPATHVCVKFRKIKKQYTGYNLSRLVEFIKLFFLWFRSTNWKESFFSHHLPQKRWKKSFPEDNDVRIKDRLLWFTRREKSQTNIEIISPKSIVYNNKKTLFLNFIFLVVLWFARFYCVMDNIGSLYLFALGSIHSVKFSVAHSYKQYSGTWVLIHILPCVLLTRK